MTLLEAIEILSNHQKWRKGADTPATDPKQLTEALEIAISALEKVETIEAENARLREKQTPKEPINKDLCHYDEGSLCIHFEHYCPVCKHLVESVYDYCGFCGQAIKNDKE